MMMTHGKVCVEIEINIIIFTGFESCSTFILKLNNRDFDLHYATDM